MMQVMTYAVSLYAGAMQGMAPDLVQLFRFVSLVVATPVVLYAAQPFFAAAWRGLRSGALGMDVPVALSIAAAYLWSVWSTLRGWGAVYFDSAVMFTFFLLLGRYVEMSLRHRSGLDQDALGRLLPDSASRLTGTKVERVTPDELAPGDRIRVLPGERIAADGEIEEGSSDVDESLLTGESVPRLRGDCRNAESDRRNRDARHSSGPGLHSRCDIASARACQRVAAADRGSGRRDRRLVRCRGAGAGGTRRTLLAANRSRARLSDGARGAGRDLPVRTLARDAGSARGRDGAACTLRAAGDSRHGH
jgi:hypothetical protein